MDQFKIRKLQESILTQSRLSKKEANKLALEIAEETNWEKDYNYQELVYKNLKENNLLRTQNQKKCKIRAKTAIK